MLSKPKTLPPSQRKSKFVAFGGGLDTQTPPLMMTGGVLIAVENYESTLSGSYARVGGVERFDGRPRPSDAQIVVLQPATAFAVAAVGSTITGLVSGASGVVVESTAVRLVLTKVSGAFQLGEMLRQAGADVGGCLSEPSLLASEINGMLAAAGDRYRADITAVPGAGPVRGIAVLKGVVYAMRDNAGGTAQAIYKATATGWQLVPLLYEVAFTGGSSIYTDGQVLSKGGVTATIRRVVLEGGDWTTGSAKGRFIIDAPAGGNFSAGAAAGGGVCTLSGAQTAITLAAGGRWQWVVDTFGASLSFKRLYGIDGVNTKPFEFDGTVLVPINTGMVGTAPTCIATHRAHLFVAYGSSLQHCGVNQPYQWTVLAGAAELGAGDEITGLISVGGSEDQAAMLVQCANRTAVLYGDAPNWKMTPLSREAGAKPYSSQVLGGPIGMDDAGIRKIEPSQAFGNFSFGMLTDHLIDQMAGLVPTASVVAKAFGRYRLFLSDGRFLSGTPGKRWSWTWCRYHFVVRAAAEGEVAGVPAVFVGDDAGMVYQCDVGRSFDGNPIEAWAKLAYGNLGMQGVECAYRGFDVEVKSKSAGTLQFWPDFSYGDPDKEAASVAAAALPPPATLWDSGSWDTGVWDGMYSSSLRIRTEGVGFNVSMLFYSLASTELPHELTGATVHYIPRRRRR